jgi:gluconokinase
VSEQAALSSAARLLPARHAVEAHESHHNHGSQGDGRGIGNGSRKGAAMAGNAQVHKIDVMGVAGCGKSTLARALAVALGCGFVEGDDHHLPESQRKMHAGIALTDADREPWLDRLAALLASDPDTGLVLSCSALKRRYRDRLRDGVPGLRFVYVEISPQDAAVRVASRPAHLFPASLVASQFEALESPLDEAGVLAVAATEPTERQLDAVLRWLGVEAVAAG